MESTQVRRWLGAVGGRWRLLAPVAAAGYLLLYSANRALGWREWLLVLLCAGVATLGGRLPLTVTAAQAVLLVAAEYAASPAVLYVKVAVGVAVFELAARQSRLRVVAGLAVVLGGYLLVALGDPSSELLPWLYRAATLVGGPALLAGYVRSLRHTAWQARQRAVEAERGRAERERAVRLAERTAIARELHDMVAHHVASMLVRADVARHVVTDADPRLTAVLDDVAGSARTALADLRSLLGALRDPSLLPDQVSVELGVGSDELAEALDRLVADARALGLAVDARVDDAVREVEALRRLVVLRLVQEGLTNATRHAGRNARVLVRVGVDHGVVRVELTDSGGSGPPAPPGGSVPLASPGGSELPGSSDGVGPPVSSGGGHGLVGLAERVELVGGSLVAGPHGPGWRLAAVLPAPATAPGLPSAVQDRSPAQAVPNPVRTP
ncbi:sensor histidine kinase [Plantactinospora solaniradicis]|uniref:histidine kinase n=1 Tax=Plantactinospora solaniradicis TaxID=1723736 RepID=A0ABW1K4N5_9ACTN